MCRNLKAIDQKSAIVYKIVAQRPKGKRYYSIAMGFKYPKKGLVPRIKVQHCLGYFIQWLLDQGLMYYKKDMVGRTAGFVNKRDAYLEKPCMHILSYNTFVIKVKLTQDLMKGTYAEKKVIAGRHMEILD